MSEKFVVSVECRFSASHTLPGCPPCDRLHGHTWKVRVSWAFSKLDGSGMGANFSTLKGVLESKIKRPFDHRHFNDTSPFDKMNPTAENIAKVFFLILKDGLDPGLGGRLERVEVWEGPDNSVSYEG